MALNQGATILERVINRNYDEASAVSNDVSSPNRDNNKVCRPMQREDEGIGLDRQGRCLCRYVIPSPLLASQNSHHL